MSEKEDDIIHVTNEQGAAMVRRAYPEAKVHIIDPKVAETVDFVICTRAYPQRVALVTPGEFTIGKCSVCKHDVIVNNKSPKLPRRLCLECCIEKGPESVKDMAQKLTDAWNSH